MQKSSKQSLPLWAWTALILWGIFLARAEAAPANRVASFVPAGQVANNAAFKMTFKDAIVEQKDVGKVVAVEDFPFVVTPSIQAEGKWLDQRTFSASLLAPLEMATAYAASVKDNLKTLRGRGVGAGTYAFRTSPLTLLAARAASFRDNRGVEIQLDFNIPVSPARLRGFLAISVPGGVLNHLNYQTSGFTSKTLRVSVP
jgi:hypothetical protein